MWKKDVPERNLGAQASFEWHTFAQKAKAPRIFSKFNCHSVSRNALIRAE